MESAIVENANAQNLIHLSADHGVGSLEHQTTRKENRRDEGSCAITNNEKIKDGRDSVSWDRGVCVSPRD